MLNDTIWGVQFTLTGPQGMYPEVIGEGSDANEALVDAIRNLYERTQVLENELESAKEENSRLEKDLEERIEKLEQEKEK